MSFPLPITTCILPWTLWVARDDHFPTSLVAFGNTLQDWYEGAEWWTQLPVLPTRAFTITCFLYAWQSSRRVSTVNTNMWVFYSFSKGAEFRSQRNHYKWKMVNTLWSPRQWPQNMLPAGTSHPDSTFSATRHSLCLLTATRVALNSAFSVPAASKQALNWNHNVVFQLCCSACGLTCYKLALQAWSWSQLSSLAEEAWEKQSPQDPKQRHCHLQLLVW